MKRFLLLGAAVLVPRLLVFPFNENLGGDAVVRVWLGDGWAANPHLITSFTRGAVQFGPLHIYLVGLAGLLWPSPEHAGRLVSLIVGALTAWPLHALTRRLFDVRAADVAVLCFACWGLHIQCSTTASSEALNLLVVMGALAALQAWLDTAKVSALLGSALLLNLACMTRYDSWLLVPMLVLVVALRSWRTALLFGAASSVFAATWMVGNALDLGDPLYPFTYINDFHRRWYASDKLYWGPVFYRLYAFFFWPGVALFTLTPLVATAGGAGMVRAWRTVPRSRWLIVVTLVPTLMYAVRSSILGGFVPLSRFAVKEVAFLLPFVWPGATWALQRLPRLGKPVLAVAVAMLVGWPLWLGLFTFRTDGVWQNSFRPVSPTSTNSPRMMRVARYLHDGNSDAGVLLVDTDPRGYDDLQFSFFTGFPNERSARLRNPKYAEHLQPGDPRWIARFEGGELETKGLATVDGGTLEFRGARFVEVDLQAAPLHLYRRE